jgi:flagellar hook-length control protein FliK
MNFEFRSAGSPSRNGILGVASSLNSSNVSQPDSIQQGMVFKDLLNQSRSSVSQKTRSTANDQDDGSQSQVHERDSGVEDNQKTATPPDKKVDKETAAAKDQNLKESGKADDAIPEQNSDSSQISSLQSLQNGLEAVAMVNFKVPLGLNEQANPEEPVTGEVGVSATVMDVQSLVPDTPETALPMSQLTEGNQAVTEEGFSMMVNQKAEASQEVILSGAGSVPVEANVKGKGLKQHSSEINPNLNGQQMVEESSDGVSDVAKHQNQQQPVGVKKDLNQNSQSATGSENLAQSVSNEAASPKTDEVTADGNNNQDLGLKGLHGSNLTELNHLEGAEVPIKVDVAQQVEQKILQNYEVNKPVVFQMTLSPDNLGDIDVQMKFSNGKLIIDIAAASQDTQNLLGKQIDQLVKGLNLQNVQVESVHLNKAVEGGSSSQNASFSMNTGSDFSQQQNNDRLRESFLRNASIQQSLLHGTSETSEDTIRGIAQSMYYAGQRRINYLV